jgi:hypothetical protein
MTWAKGVSGNPAGRKPGSGEVAKLRAGLGQRLPEILEVLVGRALEGDVGALKLVLERVLPALRPASPAVPLPGAESPGTAAHALLAAMAKRTFRRHDAC